MGVSVSDYKNILLDLEELNNRLAENEKGLNRTSLAKMPSGQLTAIGQEMIQFGYFYIPSDAKYVRFNCWTAAAVGAMFTCMTEAPDKRIGTKLGSAFTITTIDVKVSWRDCSIMIGFQTSDPNGGFANWEVMA